MSEQKIGNYYGKKVENYYSLVKGATEIEDSGVDANVFRALKEIMPNNFSGKVIVDLGAGDGRWSQYFIVHKAKKVYAIDKSSDMLDRLTKDSEDGMSAVQADMTQLPLPDNFADVGFSSFSMMYFNEKDLNKVIAETSRVLKDEGVFYIATNMINIVNESLKNNLKWKIIPIKLGVGKDKISLENIVQPIQAYKQAFQKNGLRIIREEHFRPDGVEISDDYKYARDLELEKVIFVVEKKQDLRPEWIKRNEVDKGEVKWNGKVYEYTVLKKELEPALVGFIGQFKGHFFISEEVPSEYRDLQLIHEIIEFTEISNQSGRCLKALMEEITLVPENIKNKYLNYRKDFFERLVAYHIKRKSDKKFIEEITASYEQLVSLAK